MQINKYNLIGSVEAIKEVDAYLMNEDGTHKFNLMAYDTETNGLDLYKTVLVGFSFSVNAKEGFYLPLLVWVPDEKSRKMRTRKGEKIEIASDGHFKCYWTGDIYPEDVTPAQYRMPDFIPVFLQRWTATNLIMHNAPFDVNHTFINTGVDLTNNLLVDTGLLVHIENENESVALKEVFFRYAADMGNTNVWAEVNIEKAELQGSIIKNGGTGGQVWRADLDFQCKYACSDTFKTFGIFETVMARLQNEHGENFPRIADWIFNTEVMPVCKEVVIKMKRRGVYTDVPHFKKIYDENAKILSQLEAQFHKDIAEFVHDFPLGESVEEAVSQQRFLKRVIEMEGLKLPEVTDKKTGEVKQSLAKKAVEKEFEKNPHWIWGYILGEDELKYTEAKVLEIKQELYREITGRNHRFNIGSNDHLGWLFFEKLKEEPRKFPETASSTAENYKPSLEADAIKQHLLPKYPWIKSLLKYKRVLKIQSTYVAPVLELNINGWLYMDMKQNGTTSGRFSCSGGYNLQTLPRVDDELEALSECHVCKKNDVTIDQYSEVMANRKCNNPECGHVEEDIVCPSAIKKGFIAPPGYKIINADYSSLEPRCFAYKSNEDKIMQVYKDGLDLYSKVYIDIYDKEGKYSAHPDAPNFLKVVNKKARTFIKPLVLGIPYGAGDAQVANMTGMIIREPHKTIEGLFEERPDFNEGKRIRDEYLNAYPQLQKYMDDQEYMAIQYGYVDSDYGRRRHFKYIKIIGDFFESHTLMKNDRFEKYEKVVSFIKTSKSSLMKRKEVLTIKSQSTGNEVMMLQEDDLKNLTKMLGMEYDINPMKGIKESVKTKGGWAYIRSLIKADLNNAKNHPIQSLAGHITNQGMLASNRHFDAQGLDAWVCLQVHDEITGYVKDAQAEIAKDSLQLGMEKNCYTLPLAHKVAMIAEPVICDSLKESK